MPRALLILLLASSLAGCGTEMHISCKGKGAITVTAMMYGGQIQGDCGDGFEYERKSVK